MPDVDVLPDKIVFDPSNDRVKLKLGHPNTVEVWDEEGLNPLFTVSDRPSSDSTVPGYPNYAKSNIQLWLNKGKGNVPPHLWAFAERGAGSLGGVRIEFQRIFRTIHFTGLLSHGTIRYFNVKNELEKRDVEGSSLDETISDESGIKMIHFDFTDNQVLHLFDLEMG